MLKSLMKMFLSKETLFDLMTYRLQTSKKIEDVVCNVEKLCEINKFALLHSYIYHEIVESKGFPIERKVYVYEICVARVAALVLTEEPAFAPFMPCRIAIYEESNKVVISTQNMEIMLNSFDKNSGLYQQTSVLFAKLKLLMKQIKG